MTPGPLDRAPVDGGEIHLRTDEQDEDAFLEITVELTVNGQSIYRNFRARDVSHIDWNPNINDMADSIAKSKEPL